MAWWLPAWCASEARSSCCDKSTIPSVVSVAGSEPQCYPLGTSFQVHEETLNPDDLLVTTNGVLVRVLRIKRHSSTDRVMIWLQTAYSKLPLTHNHRVMVLRGDSQRQTIPAGQRNSRLNGIYREANYRLAVWLVV